MELKLDTLKFGNPTEYQKKLIEKGNYLVSVFEDVVVDNEFGQIEDQTAEVNEIIDNIGNISQFENKEVLKLYKSIDKNLEQFLYNTLKSPRIDVLSKIQEIVNDLDPLIFKLKFYYNRIRPKQFASLFDTKLFPLSNSKNDHPSFPSRHVIIGNIVCEVILNLNPDQKETANEVKEAISQSRLYLGNNYKSDIEFSKKVTKAILKNKDFLSKYEI